MYYGGFGDQLGKVGETSYMASEISLTQRLLSGRQEAQKQRATKY